jgi:hypothetical protein
MWYIMLLAMAGVALVAFAGIQWFFANNTVVQKWAKYIGAAYGFFCANLLILSDGFSYRGVPWVFKCFWLIVLWSLVGLGVSCWYWPNFGRAVAVNIGFWARRTFRFGSKDNASANVKAIVALALWLVAWLYGWPSWGPDFTELKYQTENRAEQVWQSESMGELRSAGNYLVKGGKIPAVERALGRSIPVVVATQTSGSEAPKPLYPKGPLWVILAFLMTIIAFVDLPLTWRDDLSGFISRQIHRRKTPEVVTSPTPPVQAPSEGAAPVTTAHVPAPAATTTASSPPHSGETPMSKLLLSDFISDATVEYGPRLLSWLKRLTKSAKSA